MAVEVCEQCGTRCAVGAPKCPHCSSKRLVPEAVLAGLMPSLTVCCPNQDCPAEGVQRRVTLAMAVPGVLVMPRLLCARCGYELLNVTEDIVPKITVHGGPTNEAADEPEEGEDVSAGTSSSTSSEKEPSSPEPSEKQSPSRARTTGSRSKKAATDKDSSARSTGGGRETGTSETSSADK